MFTKFKPKEEKYFEDFRAMVSHLQEIAKLTNDFFCADSYDKDIFLKLKPIERRIDEIEGKIVKRLNKTFITPFDREDIFALSKRLDDIADILLGAAIRVDMYNLEDKIDHAGKICAIVVQQLNSIEKIVNFLRNNKEPYLECKAIKDLETEADNVFRTAMKELFTNEKDPLRIMKKKEILELLENASDKCQSTSNVMLSIYIKNA